MTHFTGKVMTAMMIAAMMAVPVYAEEAVTEAEEVQEATPLADWAYGFTLGSEDAGVGTIYYTKAYFETEGRVNPATAAAYTEEELQALNDAAVTGAADYITIFPGDAFVGMSAYDSGQIFWYDEEAANAIVASADPLGLLEDGSLADLEGNAVAQAMPALENWAYGAITLDSEYLGIGTVYYAEGYYETEGRINPVTTAPYTDAELAQIKAAAVEGNAAYVSDVPEGAVIGISVYAGEDILWFDAETAEAIVASADPFVLDTENGALVTMDGQTTLEAM